MGFYRGPKIVTDGLSFYLDAANSRSYPGTGTSWKDLSGNGNDITLINGPTFDSENKGVIKFDGTDDYALTTLTGINLDSECSIEGVLRRDDTFTSWRTFFNIKPSSATTPFFEFRSNLPTQDITTSYWNGSTNFETNSTPLLIGDYGHAVATYDGSGNISFFLNGTLIDTITGVPSFALGNNPRLTIGRAYSDDRYTEITVPFVRVYNRALTSQEVLQNYNATKQRFK